MSIALVPVFGGRPPFVKLPGSGAAYRFRDGSLMAGEHGPVIVCVAIHDQHHFATKAQHKARLRRQQTPRMTEHYRHWAEQETEFYAALGLDTPSWAVKKHEQAPKTCRRGHLLSRHGRPRADGRVNCRLCQRDWKRGRR